MRERERKENALKYMPAEWNKTWPLMHQRDAINETFNLIKQNILDHGVTVNFRGQTLRFDCLSADDLNVHWKFSDLGDCSGVFFHDKNCIEFNNRLKQDGFKLYETLYHEYTHKLQSALVKHIDAYPKGSAEYEYLVMIRNEATHQKVNGQAFGKSFFGDSYLSPTQTSRVLQKTIDFAVAAYDLQLSERSARTTGYNAYEYILSLCNDRAYVQNHMLKNPNTLEEAFEVVRRECGVPNLTQAAICKAFDDAKFNIEAQRSPTQNNDFEAMVTYKLATLLRAQSALDSNQYEAINEYISDSTERAMNQSMLTHYEVEGLMFVPPNSNQRIGNYVFANDLFTIENCSSQVLEEMSESEQVRNPHVIAYTIMLEGSDVLNHIHNIEAFQLWHYSDLNDLSPGMQESLQEILGDDYSPQFVAEMNRALNGRLFDESQIEQEPQRVAASYDAYFFNHNIDGHENQNCAFEIGDIR